jgi:hypothetical protein
MTTILSGTCHTATLQLSATIFNAIRRYTLPSMFTSTCSDCAARRRDVMLPRAESKLQLQYALRRRIACFCTDEGRLNAGPASTNYPPHFSLCDFCCAVVYYQLELTSSVQPGQALVTALCWLSMRAPLNCTRCLQPQASSAVAVLACAIAVGTCTILQQLQHQ